MNKLAALLSASMLFSVLTACGNSALPLAQIPLRAPATAPQAAAQLQAQSVLGINKEIKRSVEAAFAAKDKNADKFITPDEFPVTTPLEFQHFRKMDSNKDGRLTASEMSPGIFGKVMDIMQLTATASFLFDQLDVNNDGKLMKEEAAASTLPGVAANFDTYLSKPWYSSKKLTYLRRTDFENLVAFAMTNPEAKK
ncbi:hypothetical protein COW36_23920 [bacterium (Candidatus Blackallbacteria) CG17_big_fil_post_rev_8_21_14_2_50_48_46]|uniref:EF-hand domain-containing protein n=1 Tax=bacterium (Candidatus Blackallbacteria) CG17_big_fil_post_rev_8_21_14_2_50_48_46 TaxID=2014261 RepID=A0A2M7FXB6_9BACT|nr:MAG: hypothetical protein COW64_18860 [bacterium (Candidatus Blackallbacteria) CG18_big_fil_WC_8_21_14_2_50_49_26]PIW13722.1 MAG: hypothetical protein COW36_23920 [bacterium (Candidatus Blackallbacteria) CG17_big_fil_post_rev_8_21_14_2_50_48_46]PIW44948.1 MAG: hypothetical protein COW20_21550 [bacterium (Candidatus Blackallbacteria) CG13_big_fil_rev_8_21_14_2_50_49_14]